MLLCWSHREGNEFSEVKQQQSWGSNQDTQTLMSTWSLLGYRNSLGKKAFDLTSLPVVRISLCPSIHLPAHPFIHLYIHPLTHPPIHQSTHPFIHQPIHPSVHLPINPFVYTFVNSPFSHLITWGTEVVDNSESHPPSWRRCPIGRHSWVTFWHSKNSMYFITPLAIPITWNLRWQKSGQKNKQTWNPTRQETLELTFGGGEAKRIITYFTAQFGICYAFKCIWCLNIFLN